LLDLKEYYTNEGIIVDRNSWSNIKTNYDRQEIKQSLHKIFEDFKPLFPFPNISLEQAISDFQKLKELDTTNVIKSGKWNPKFEYENHLSTKYFSRNLVGRKASAFFMDEIRYAVGCYNKPSLVKSWNDFKFRDKTFDAIFTLGLKEINEKRFLEAMRMKHYLPSQFSPAIAKSIFQYFNSKKVLDMSSGWGDRLVGSYEIEYRGFDPNLVLKDKYDKIINTYGLNARVENIPFEDSVLEDNYYDIMFSSPPYFNRETYSTDMTQSSIRYKNIDEWINLFLYKSIDKIYHALKSRGILAINISDLQVGKKRIEICNAMNNHIASTGMKYIGCYGLQLTKMLNSKSYYMDGVFGEPIWIWEK